MPRLARNLPRYLAAKLDHCRTVIAVAIAVSLWAPACFAQTGTSVTIDPAMTRGPATAPVTIVEFSDYQ